MGYPFEDLIRRFNESAATENDDYFNQWVVIRLMVELLLTYDHEALAGTGSIRTICDPTVSTGCVAAIGGEEMRRLNKKIRVQIFGQERIEESYAICKSDMLITGHDLENIAFCNTLIGGAFPDHRFHHVLSNPPYSVDWKKSQDKVKAGHETQGDDGRFGAGLPRMAMPNNTFIKRQVWMAASLQVCPQPRLLASVASQVITGSNQIVSKPRC